MSSHGRGCPCGAGRGFRTVDHAMHVFWAMTRHLGLTRAPDFTRCDAGKWHWETRAVAHA